MLRPSISGTTAPLVGFLLVFVLPMELPQQAISCLGNNPHSVSERNPLCPTSNPDAAPLDVLRRQTT